MFSALDNRSLKWMVGCFVGVLFVCWLGGLMVWCFAGKLKEETGRLGDCKN
jgi:hypothetical protein